jgi:hypothetical protein
VHPDLFITIAFVLLVVVLGTAGVLFAARERSHERDESSS